MEQQQQQHRHSIIASVRPHKAAYFAGEKLECTIEFTLAPTTDRPIANHLQSPYSPFLPSPLHLDLEQFPSRPSLCPSSVYSSPLVPTFHSRRSSLLPIGSSAPPHRASFPRKSSYSAPNSPSCLLAWSYCQLDGYFELQPKHINLDHFQSLRHPQTLGGGRLSFEQEDLTQDQYQHDPQPRKKSSSSNSWMAWLFGSNSSSDLPQNLCSSSFHESIPSNRFPVFQNPISLLDIDVRLEPGQSRSYTFSIDLPINLPPTHKSKWIKFNYELIVGTHLISEPISSKTTGFIRDPYSRTTSSRSSSSSAGPINTKFPSPTSPLPHHNSRTFRVPIRVFNHVYLNETNKTSYDLFKPIISTKDTATIRRLPSSSSTFLVNNDYDIENHLATINQIPPKVNRPSWSQAEGRDEEGESNNTILSGLAGLEKYGLELLKGHIDADGRANGKKGDEDGEGINHSCSADELDFGCLTAVEIATRSSPKVAFDIIKDGVLVAQLSLVKSIYRLGETIEGTIELNSNDPVKEAGRVIKFGISLESVETWVDPKIINNNSSKINSLTSPISTLTNSHKNEGVDKQTSTSKIFAEQEELVVDLGRAKFALAIPNQASPEFETNSVKFKWNLKLRLQIIPTRVKEDHNHHQTHLSPLLSAKRWPSQNGALHPTFQEDQFVPNPPEEDANHNHHHRRLGSVDCGSEGRKSERGNRRLAHARSKSNGFFNPAHPAERHRGYSHFVAHAAHQGIFKPVPDLSMIPIDSPDPALPLAGLAPHPLEDNDHIPHLSRCLKPQPSLVPVTPVFVDCLLPIHVLPAATLLKPAHHRFVISQ